jgi:hypothetical protein
MWLPRVTPVCKIGDLEIPLKTFRARILRACISFTGLPCAQDTGGENPYIDTKDVLKLLIVGDSAVRLLVTLGAW